MTEREAQEAAISSFGPVRAVVRAHQARLTMLAVVLGDASMAAWKLASLLLVTSGFAGLATMVIFTLLRPLTVYYEAGGETWVTVVPNQGFRWLALSAITITGVILLVGYCLAPPSPAPPREPACAAGRVFPVVAASFFAVTALTLVVLNLSGTEGMFDPGLTIATCTVLAAGYAVRMAWTFRRSRPRRRGLSGSGHRLRHARGQALFRQG